MSDKPYKAKPGTFPEKKELDNDRVTREDFIRQWHNEVEEMMLTYLKRKAETACGDLISREAAVRLIREKADVYKASQFASSHEHIKVREMTLDCAAKIENLPAVDAEPVRHAKWVHKTDSLGNKIDVCSACEEEAVGYDGHHGDYITVPTDYCPHCGAKMDGGNEE